MDGCGERCLALTEPQGVGGNVFPYMIFICILSLYFFFSQFPNQASGGGVNWQEIKLSENSPCRDCFACSVLPPSMCWASLLPGSAVLSPHGPRSSPGCQLTQGRVGAGCHRSINLFAPRHVSGNISWASGFAHIDRTVR